MGALCARRAYEDEREMRPEMALQLLVKLMWSDNGVGNPGVRVDRPS